jgi:CUG-BP- and ETR3-like factor
LLAPFGTVSDVAIIRNRVTGQHRGCAFAKMNSPEEANDAIAGLHASQTLPGMNHPVQVKLADAEGSKPPEFKLFVGMLPKTLDEQQMEMIFQPFGTILETYLLREKDGTGKGCGFVKFATRNAADAAISALNGVKKVEGAPGPLVVRFADTPRDKQLKRQMAGGYGMFPPNAPGMPLGMMGGGGMGIGGMGMGGMSMGGGGMGGMGLPYGMPPQPPSSPSPNNIGMAGGQGGAMGPMGMGMGMPQQPQAGQPWGAGGYGQGGYGMNMGLQSMPALGQQSQEGPPGCNLFIYHLPQEFTDTDLAIAFSSFGQVISAKIFIDKQSGLSKGFGFVSYNNPEAANTAIQAMNGFQLGAKRLKVQLKTQKQRTSPY